MILRILTLSSLLDGQSFPLPYLIQLATGHLNKSRFATYMAMMQIFHSATKMTFTSLEDMKLSLTRLDPKRGLATVAVVTPTVPKSGWRKKGTAECLFSAVATGSSSPVSEISPITTENTMHPLAWIGAIDLDKAQVLKVKSVFQCFLYQSNAHPWPVCEFLASKWNNIKKKPEDGKSTGRKTPSEGSASAVTGGSDLLVLLEDTLQTLAPVSAGTANSVRFATSFDIVADSGATSTMVPWKELFISYQPTPGSYVILANNQKTPC